VATAIVYVHGLWFSGREAAWLRHQLARELDAEDRAFSYPSVSATVADSAAALGRFLAAMATDTVHLVGHSLGGLVILQLFEDSAAGAAPQLPAGRVVLMGSPLHGSRAAQALARLPFGRSIMGRGVEEELLEDHPRHWSGARALGVIAGDLSFGLGRLLGPLAGPNDGTVMVEETLLEGATDQLVLRVSHSSMLFSAAVARQAAAFLRDGKFMR